MWKIDLLENNLKIKSTVAKELFKQSQEGEEIWYSEAEVRDKDGLLTFNPDHMEHMDYIFREEYTNILCKHKVKGRVTFGSLDGDDFGQFWGYEFDGKGNLTKLKGEIQWSPINIKSKNKKTTSKR